MSIEKENSYKRIPKRRITVLLKCPECGCEREFSSSDFEELVYCPRCEHKDEAWFFWHKPKGYPGEVWTIGDHYPNDALLLPESQFLECFLDTSDRGIWFELFKREDGLKFADVTIHHREIYYLPLEHASSFYMLNQKIESLIKKFAELVEK